MHSPSIVRLSAPLALVLTLALGARAQFRAYGIPPCASGCMEQAAMQGRCGFTDIGCICTALSDAPVMDTAVACGKAACPATTTTRTDGGVETAFERFFGDHCQG